MVVAVICGGTSVEVVVVIVMGEAVRPVPMKLLGLLLAAQHLMRDFCPSSWLNTTTTTANATTTTTTLTKTTTTLTNAQVLRKAPTACQELPKEEVRPHQPPPNQEEAQVNDVGDTEALVMIKDQ